MRHKTPKAFLIFLALILITELTIYYIGQLISVNPSDLIVKTQNKISRSKNLDKDILVFGDSTSAMAIDPDISQSHTGLKTYNFSTLGPGIMAINYLLLKNYLLRNRPPKFIILMNAYDTWHRGIGSNDVINVLGNNCFMETLKALVEAGTKNDVYNFILYKIFLTPLPSQHYKYEIARFAKLKYNPLKDKKRYTNSYFFQELLGHKGSYRFMLNQNILNYSKEVKKEKILRDLLEHEKFVELNKFYVSGLNKYFLDKFIKDAQRNKIQVLICFPPLLQDFYDLPESRHYLRDCRAFLKETVSAHPNMLLLTKDFYPVNSSSLEESIDHLDAQESAIFTRLITGDLSEK